MYDDFDSYGIQEYSIEDIREELGNIVNYFKNVDYYEDALKTFICNERQLPIEVGYECDAFFVDENTTISEIPDWMKLDSLGFVKYNKYLVYAGRLVYPVKDVKGNVMGFCGWDKFTEPKYLDSKNYGYIAKNTSLYGMEKIEEYYNSNRPVYVVEGIVCCLYLRSLGYQALALLGSSLSPYVIQILKRFGSRLILVPDNDEAGDSLVKRAKYALKKCVIVQVRYGKDIDGCRKIDEHKYESALQADLKMLTNPFCKLNIFIRR